MLFPEVSLSVTRWPWNSNHSPVTGSLAKCCGRLRIGFPGKHQKCSLPSLSSSLLVCFVWLGSNLNLSDLAWSSWSIKDQGSSDRQTAPDPLNDVHRKCILCIHLQASGTKILCLHWVFIALHSSFAFELLISFNHLGVSTMGIPQNRW